MLVFCSWQMDDRDRVEAVTMLQNTGGRCSFWFKYMCVPLPPPPPGGLCIIHASISLHSSLLSHRILDLLIRSSFTSLLSAMPGELESELPQIDPRILIFLLYMVILQELVSGWMEYKKLACKPKKKPGPVWSSSYTRSSSRMSLSPLTMNTVRRDRTRDSRKPGRIFRKA